ncbi:MAG TPA: glycosyl transferase family 9, partial [Arthrobacter bacterium]|nr:glycosyl transferase family 9 [Arthrobacter sp.]
RATYQFPFVRRFRVLAGRTPVPAEADAAGA